MRILHTSDWHLGRTFHGRVLDEAQAAFADHLVELVEAESVDAVVVSGDVYDRAIPPTASVSLLDDTLARLADRTRVVLTSGNHDSAQRLAFGSGLLREGLSIRARPAQVDQPVLIPDADGGTGLYVYALPYLDPDGARETLPPLLSLRLGEGDPEAPTPLARSHEAVVSGALRLVAHDLAARRGGAGSRVPALVMAHAFVVGGRASEDSERDIRVGGVDSVPGEVFTTLGGSAEAAASGGLDYVALGHLHRPQEIRQGSNALDSGDAPTVGGPRLVYSGSPLPFSFAEADSPKSSVLLAVGADGVTSLERVPAPLPYRATTLRGTLDELLGRLGDGHERDWVRVELTGPMPPETMARLKERFPDMLAFSWSRPAEPRTQAARVTRTSDPVEVSERFLARMLGRDPDDAERAVLTEAYDAVRATREDS